MVTAAKVRDTIATRVETLDVVVIGAGVVGIAVARALALAGREVTVLEAEPRPGQHASSRNSEVIHAGIYYPPGSLKARACMAGRDALYRYCGGRDIAHRRIGKLLVACSEAEIPALLHLGENARASGVDDLRRLSQPELRALEPEVEAVAALLSPSTGIVDSHALLDSLLADLHQAGGTLVCRSPVTGGRVGGELPLLEVGGADGVLRVACRTLVNCAGANAPALARALGVPAAQLPPAYYARGHWFALVGASPFRRLVYPVPEPGGLGVHVTLDLAGAARFGPDVQWVDGIDYRFAADREASFRAAIARYYPGIAARELLPAHCGIRAKIAGPGEPAQDFRIEGPREHGIPGLVNLFGIESPGLTAALALADVVRTQCA
ncbi:MAG: L-2-hydroxyglutarate oxidase LhgO [Pseudomonadales bacterium]|nr:L-2-hydroxyglutarate oxidase LhgO [Pseudomonadales bacterium]